MIMEDIKIADKYLKAFPNMKYYTFDKGVNGPGISYYGQVKEDDTTPHGYGIY